MLIYIFGIYIDVLIKQLRNSGHGCYVGPFFVGCIAYADDIVLMSPTKLGLAKMLDICQDYSVSYHLQFNGMKSKFIVFSSIMSENVSISVFGNLITNASSVVHLGHRLYADLRKDDTEGVIASTVQYVSWQIWQASLLGTGWIIYHLLFKFLWVYVASIQEN